MGVDPGWCILPLMDFRSFAFAKSVSLYTERDWGDLDVLLRGERRRPYVLVPFRYLSSVLSACS